MSKTKVLGETVIVIDAPGLGETDDGRPHWDGIHDQIHRVMRRESPDTIRVRVNEGQDMADLETPETDVICGHCVYMSVANNMLIAEVNP